jgi:hexosaminidase
MSPLVALLLLASQPQVDVDLPLMPWPARVERAAGQVDLSAGVRLEVNDADGRPTRALRRLLKRHGIKHNKRGPLLALGVDGRARGLHPSLEDDEGYLLAASERGIVVRAREPAGALRGLATLAQLIEGKRVPRVDIDDQPRFPWRGLLLDVARHAFSAQDVVRTLDAMAAAKLNVLHLHLTDNQAFRLCVPAQPELCEHNPDGASFSARELDAIVAAARERSIRVVPEVDVPGHTASWFLARPDLSAAPLDDPRAPPTSLRPMDDTLDPTKAETYRVVQQVFAEVTRRFPDRFIHVGGDEVNGKQWRANPKIRAYMLANRLKDKAELQAHFLARVARLPALKGRRVVGWDEILDADVPSGVVGHAWRGPAGLTEATRRGHDAIFSYDLYLDLGEPASKHYAWTLPDLTPAQQARVLGGEAAMWTELVDRDLLDGRVWPRALAVAERLWSPAHVRDEDAMYARLDRAAAKLPVDLHRHRRALARALVGDERARDLLTVAGLFRPTPGYRRHVTRHYHQHTPLNRFVDLVRADPPLARAPALDTAALIAACMRLEKHLSRWPAPPTSRAIDRAEVLAIVRTARVALDAAHSDAQTREARRRNLERASAPAFEVELAVTGALAKLID